jgi:hypothetical protein
MAKTAEELAQLAKDRRDLMAAAALRGLLSGRESERMDPDTIAKKAVLLADALIKALDSN